MIAESTLETLKAMHCTAMARELENQLKDPLLMENLVLKIVSA